MSAFKKTNFVAGYLAGSLLMVVFLIVGALYLGNSTKQAYQKSLNPHPKVLITKQMPMPIRADDPGVKP
jgi:hypothetical protein